MDLGIVIVNWNVRDLLRACLESVFVDLIYGQLTGRVVVVDHASTDGSAQMVRREFSAVTLIEAENRGMGAGNNLGLRALASRPTARSTPPFAALILNPDTVVRPGALRQLVAFLRSTPAAGVAAPALFNADGTLQHAAFRFPGVRQAALDLFPPGGRLARLIDSPLNGRYPAGAYTGPPFRVDHTLGAAFAVRAEALDAEPLFDEAFSMYCEEIDAQWRLRRRGWEAWIVPGAQVVHYGGRSTSQAAVRSLVQLWTSRRRLYLRYHGPLANGLVRRLVEAGMRRRIRDNFRRSRRGEISADRRAEWNQALQEIIRIWQSRRLPADSPA